MYKIFKVTYNNGGWYSGDLPHFFYIAESKEDVISNSKKYQDYFNRGGDIWISEVSSLVDEFRFENLEDFTIKISVRKKD